MTKPSHVPTVLVRSPTSWPFMICADVFIDHCLNCIYRAGAGNENTTTPEKRQSRIRQIQSTKARPSPWPGVNQPDQLSQERRSPDSVVESSPHTGNNTTTTPQAETPLCDSASKDGLSGINIHTNGTEFYGNSSNLAFLGNLYARARNQAENRTLNASENEVYPASTSSSQPTTSQQPYQTSDSKDAEKATSDKAQLSIVNLLYNPNYPSHSPSSQSTLTDKESRNVQVGHNLGSTGNIIIGKLRQSNQRCKLNDIKAVE